MAKQKPQGLKRSSLAWPFLIAGALGILASLGLLYMSLKLLLDMPAPASVESAWTPLMAQMQMSFLHLGIGLGIAAIVCFAAAGIIASIEMEKPSTDSSE
jgi:high-affinity Fe2+/Pb2+ permease